MLHLEEIIVEANYYNNYRIEVEGSFPMWVIKPKAQGQIPEALRGMYTSVPEAKKDIDKYERTAGSKTKVKKVSLKKGK